MNIELTSDELLCLLDSVHLQYISNKSFFAVNPDEEARVGLVEPEILKALYNNILLQAQNEGEYKFLHIIK